MKHHQIGTSSTRLRMAFKGDENPLGALAAAGTLGLAVANRLATLVVDDDVVVCGGCSRWLLLPLAML